MSKDSFFFTRFYKAEEKMIPEIHSVADFMAGQLGDCSGDKDTTFMTLRVSYCPIKYNLNNTDTREQHIKLS